MGITDRLKAIWHELPDFIGKAHAEGAHKIPDKVTLAAKAAMGSSLPP